MVCKKEWGNKLSLKDRFNAANAKNQKDINIEQNFQQYYQSNEDMQNSLSLGVVDTLLEDDDINAIFVNGPKNIFIERKTKLHRSTSSFRDEIQLQNIIKKYSNSENDFIKFNYKQGFNIVATLPPLSNVSTMHIKCYRDKFATLEHLEENQAISKEISMFLQTLLKFKKNILIIGKRKTLKTTLLSAMAKKMPTNFRYSFVDFSKEVSIEKTNFSNYDLFEIEEKKETSILKSIFYSTSDMVFLNDCTMPDCVVENLLDGFKGVVLNINATSREEAIEKISLKIQKTMPQFSEEKAKKEAYKIFDFAIFVENKEDKKVTKISEILNNDDDFMFNDIFLLNENNEHYSTGYAPDMFLEDDIDSINLNIFNSDYKHTYTMSPFKDLQKKGLNPEILKKFRKDLNSDNLEKFIPQKQEQITSMEKLHNLDKQIVQNIKEEDTSEIKESMDIVYNDEFMKKAQEKFDEIKRNLKNEEQNS